MDPSNLPPGMYICHFCDGYFSNVDDLSRHLQRLGKELTCCVCSITISCKVIKNHAREHSDRIVLVCTVCLQSFSSKYGLSRHRESHKQKIHPENSGPQCICCSGETTFSSEESQGKDVTDSGSVPSCSKHNPSTNCLRDPAPSKGKRQKSCQRNYGPETPADDEDSRDGELIISVSTSKRKRKGTRQSGRDLKLGDVKEAFDNPPGSGQGLADGQGTSSLTRTTGDSVSHPPCDASTLTNRASPDGFTEDGPERRSVFHHCLESSTITGFSTSPVSGDRLQESGADQPDSTIDDHSYVKRNAADENLTAANSDSIWICDNCFREFSDRSSYFTHIKRRCK